jgi:hypothetical protein
MLLVERIVLSQKSLKTGVFLLRRNWRREWDSNPR